MFFYTDLGTQHAGMAMVSVSILALLLTRIGMHIS